MAKQFSMDDYVDVAERIQDFKDAHPRGVLRQVGWDVREVGNGTFVVYIARAYPDPITEPDVYSEGTAWEPFPGKTPYTKDSELMNAETAAWGRAIIALGLVSNRKLASRQEVRNRMADQAADAEAEQSAKPAKKAPSKPAKTKSEPEATSTPSDPPPSDAALKGIHDLYLKSGLKGVPADDAPKDFDPHAQLRLLLVSNGVSDTKGEVGDLFSRLTRAQFEAVWLFLEDGAGETP